MYESWYKDLEEKNDFARSYSILQGSFVNPEMAQNMIKNENPDFESDDATMDKLFETIEEENKQKLATKHRRRRTVVK